jgi:hypothetical protein
LVGVFGGIDFRITYPNGDQVEWTAMLFECRVIGGVLAPRDGEALELRYFAAHELPILDLPYPRTLLVSAREDTEPTFQWAEGWPQELEG